MVAICSRPQCIINCMVPASLTFAAGRSGCRGHRTGGCHWPMGIYKRSGNMTSMQWGHKGAINSCKLTICSTAFSSRLAPKKTKSHITGVIHALGQFYDELSTSDVTLDDRGDIYLYQTTTWQLWMHVSGGSKLSMGKSEQRLIWPWLKNKPVQARPIMNALTKFEDD